MAGSFSDTAYRRLPATVKKLSRDAQTVCIYLRLRKTEEQIARESGFTAERVFSLAEEVRNTLIASGEYDIISDPSFVSLDAPEGGGGGAEPAAAEGAPEDRVLVSNFLAALRVSIAALDSGERRLLHLFFERRMTGGQILDFYRKSAGAFDLEPPPEKQADIFYAVEKALKNLLSVVSSETPIGRGTLTVKNLKEILFQTGAAL